jgi:hypothetical protein
MAQFDVTELDFQNIKDSIKDHFKSQSKYNDFDFDGSNLSVLLDILAYNTHYNAMVAHFSINESFLDSAQIRGNVVSHAKTLGYVPRSVQASSAKLNVTVAGTGVSPATLTMERGTRFQTASPISGSPYVFLTLEAATASKNSSNKYVFSGVTTKQGVLKRMLYLVDNSIENQKFIIPEANVDTSTIRVRVKTNQDSDDYQVYTRFSSLSGITAESLVYFIQENASGKFEIFFGDGILGEKPINDNIVEVEYIYTQGAEANNCRGAFTALDSIGSFSGGSIAVSYATGATSTFGGADRETIESIRYNAPLTYLSQNRAVTADDYRSLIIREFGNIDSISVWGGEKNTEPDYGKVYIAIKPTGAAALNAAEKNNIITAIENKNIVSITPTIVDPDFTYIKLDVFFKYNPNLTDNTKIALEGMVRNRLQTYAQTYLQRFDGVFRYSKLLAEIDSVDKAILNSVTRVYMFKDITPSNVTANSIDITFASPIYASTSTSSILTSSEFKIGGVVHYLRDAPITGSVNRNIFLCRRSSGAEVRVANLGTLYAASGRIVINKLLPDTTDIIRLTVLPNSFDLAPKRNQLLDIALSIPSGRGDLEPSTVTGEIDTIAVSGSSGAVNYTTVPRHE